MDAGAVSTRRLTVNAAFLKDIKDDNRDLKILVDRLNFLTHPRHNAGGHWHELVGVLADFRDQLAMHFGLEEAYGYFDAAIDADADVSRVAEMLKLEHGELFESLRHLVDKAEATEAVVPTDSESIEGTTPELTAAQEAILRRIERFLQSFHRHEEAELKLILDSLDEDLGVGD
ncbi:MAG: hemerythrin domain-containing protein [Planctomycetota bacterium]